MDTQMSGNRIGGYTWYGIWWLAVGAEARLTGTLGKQGSRLGEARVPSGERQEGASKWFERAVGS